MDPGQMKKETLNITNCIEIDKEKAKNFLIKKGNYRQPGVCIERWKIENSNDNFASYLEKNKFSYLGILNSKLKRHKFGINTFENGDKYIGNFDNDKREGSGVYIHSVVEAKDFQNNEVYLGNWKENTKHLKGIYVWLKEKRDSVGYDSANMDVFLGIVDQDALVRGCYLSKINNKYYAYFGKFEANGTKSDEKAYFYDFLTDKVICGQIHENKFKNCYLLITEKTNNSSKLAYIEFDDNDSISHCTNQDKIEEKIRDEYTNSMREFRKILLAKDYVKAVYDNIYLIKSISDKNSLDVSFLQDEKKFQNVVDISTNLNDLNLFNLLDNSNL